LLSVKRSLIEVGRHPRIVSSELVDIRLLKQEPISPIPLVVDSQTGYPLLLKSLIRTSSNHACVSLLNLLVLDAA
jgi:hypothetical protein